MFTASHSHDDTFRAALGAPLEQEAIRTVLAMLQEHGMDVAFAGQFTEGERRFRVVEALRHGRAAARATGRDVPEPGQVLESPVVLRDGSVFGTLCSFSTDPACTERELRWLRHGARLAARLLDHEKVMRELSAQALSH